MDHFIAGVNALDANTNRSTTASSKAPIPLKQAPAVNAPPIMEKEVASPASIPAQGKRHGPIPIGLRTPNHAFVIPVLQVLEERKRMASQY